MPKYFDIPTVIAIIMLLGAFMSTRMMGRRSRGSIWRSSYFLVLIAILHICFLYGIPNAQIGRFSSEAWAAITAAAIAGIAADDDADAVGLLLVFLGVVQLFLLAGFLNLRAA